jgi:hypothetical protein
LGPTSGTERYGTKWRKPGKGQNWPKHQQKDRFQGRERGANTDGEMQAMTENAGFAGLLACDF